MQSINGVLKSVTNNLSGKIAEKGKISGEMKGANDYNSSINKPSINGVTLVGDNELTDIVRNFEGVLSADGWSDTAPYTQTVTIDSITADMSPIVDIVFSAYYTYTEGGGVSKPITGDTTITMFDKELAEAEKTAWSCISKAITGENSITFVCFDTVPEVTLNFKVKVV